MNGYTNGVNGHGSPEPPAFERFSAIPPAIDVPLADTGDAVEVNLEELMDDPTEMCYLLENENVARNYWMTIAMAYAKQNRVDHAVNVVVRALSAKKDGRTDDKLMLLVSQCWLHFLQCRGALRVKPEGQLASEARTKEYYLQQATSTLNEASRINPTYPPLFLARGVLQLLRASLQVPKPGPQGNADRINILQQASKSFDDAIRTSGGQNVMAVLGKARTLFSLGSYAQALSAYQSVLELAPDLHDPDPRIGIGCCMWQLGHKEEANNAWQRSLEVNPKSKVATILLGLYHLDQSSQYPTTDPEFQNHYKKAMTQYTQTAWKLDNKYPLSCATFGNYFLLRKAWPTVDRLARQAIEATDVNAIASDGWYLLARKEHWENNVARAAEYYGKADLARGGEDKGYLPAKFGAAQLKVVSGDLDGAKFRLEKIVQQSKNIEAMTLLGILHAEEVYASQASGGKEDKSTEMRKAIAFLEQVRMAWKDVKRKISPDSTVLLNLARLYEIDSPEKSLQCLQQVEQMEIDEIPDEDRPEGIEDEAAMRAALRESLPPQLLNNIAAFHYQAERYGQAREFFQSALNACVKIGDKDATIDTDALVTTISFNLARTYEVENMLDEAKKVYEGLLERHPEYVDARIRLTLIALKQDPKESGSQAIKALMEAEPSNLDVRALYGWHIHRSKRRTHNVNEDQEQRHYKHTLQQFDKHDRYSLTGMGNLFSQIAREMPRATDQDKERRSKMYSRAVEFFDKALQLDPKNAYAAQGIAIVLVEEKKDHTNAIQLFTKVRETIKDASVSINLGNVFTEKGQYARATENYEAALAKDRTHDPQILASLGRVWLMRGKQEKSVPALKTSLEYAQRALEYSPEQVHFKFNVAFVQIQIAQLIYSLPEAARTLADVEAAYNGLDEAIESLGAIAKAPNPPFPKHDIEQRANMGRNTMRKQLERAMQSQREFESKNAARLEQARQTREAEIRKREEEKRAVEEKAEEERRKIREERERIREQDRMILEQKLEEERAREEADLTTDEETGEKRKREKKPKKGGKRKKKGDESDTDPDAETDGEFEGKKGRKSRGRSTGADTATGEDGEERPKKKKRRKLERKTKQSGKFKSSEVVVDSDSDDEQVTQMNDNARLAEKINEAENDNDESGDDMFGEEEEEQTPAESRRKKPARILDEDEDDEDELAGGDAPMEVTNGAADADISMVDESVGAAGNENAQDGVNEDAAIAGVQN